MVTVSTAGVSGRRRIQFVFGVLHAEVPTGLKLDELNRRYGPAEIEAEIICWAVGEVESRLLNGLLPAIGATNVEGLELAEAQLLEIEQTATQKTCAYQVARGRELFCAAAAPTDATISPQLGMAPTSRPACKVCDLADDQYRCAQLTHPSVIGIGAMIPTGRDLRAHPVRLARQILPARVLPGRLPVWCARHRPTCKCDWRGPRVHASQVTHPRND